MLVDSVACIGFRKCEAACNRQHKLSDASAASFEDKTVFDRRRRPDATAYTVVNQFRNPTNPQTPYKRGPVVTFHHREHIELFDLGCVNCHAGWQPGNFSRVITGLRLDEIHAEFDCESCHIDLAYDEPPDCSACHDDDRTHEDAPPSEMVERVRAKRK